MDGKTAERLAALRDEGDKIKANHAPTSMYYVSGRSYRQRFQSLGEQVMTADAREEPFNIRSSMEMGNKAYRRETPFSSNLLLYLRAVTHTDIRDVETLTEVEAYLRRVSEPADAEPLVKEKVSLGDLDYPSDPLNTWKNLVALEETFANADAYDMASTLLAPETDAERPHPVA
jgi:hypothetical protein